MERANPLMTHSYKCRLYVYTQKLKLKAKRDGIEWQEWLNNCNKYMNSHGQAPLISWNSYCEWRIVGHRCKRACSEQWRQNLPLYHSLKCCYSSVLIIKTNRNFTSTVVAGELDGSSSKETLSAAHLLVHLAQLPLGPSLLYQQLHQLHWQSLHQRQKRPLLEQSRNIRWEKGKQESIFVDNLDSA